MRTTSSLECMNSVLRRMFPLHPHIFKFMDCLRYHEFGQQLRMFKLVKEEATKKQLDRKRKKDQKRNVKIKAYTDELLTNPLFSVGEFLKGLSSHDDHYIGKRYCNPSNLNF